MRDGKVDVGLDGFIRLQSAMKDFAEAEIARVAPVVKNQVRARSATAVV